MSGHSHLPPVPPDNRSDKGPGDTPSVETKSGGGTSKDVPGNLEDQGRQGNIHQNTTHQGYQQDR